jgi:hypothetical protein
MIVARLVESPSNLATARALCEEAASGNLVWELGLDVPGELPRRAFGRLGVSP